MEKNKIKKGDCIYTPLEKFSYYSGVISILFYFIGKINFILIIFNKIYNNFLFFFF